MWKNNPTAYTNAIKDALEVTLCLRDHPSEIVEKDNKPEVELKGYSTKTKALALAPIYLARSEKEKCLIETSINSTRVINIKHPLDQSVN